VGLTRYKFLSKEKLKDRKRKILITLHITALAPISTSFGICECVYLCSKQRCIVFSVCSGTAQAKMVHWAKSKFDTPKIIILVITTVFKIPPTIANVPL